MTDNTIHMPYVRRRETAREIAWRIRNGIPAVPVFIDAKQPVEGLTISSINRVVS
jgi:hypothetical protein